MTEAIISYVPQIVCQWRKEEKQMKISHKDLNTFDFNNKSLFEVINNPEHIRLFFDFDHTETVDECDDLLNFLENLKEKYGEYALAGYTTDKEIAEFIGVRYYDYNELNKQVEQCDKGKKAKVFSCHVVFYESRVNAEQLRQVMDDKKYIKPKCIDDISVYKFPRLFRHPFSAKVFNTNKRINNAGSSVFDNTASELVITCDGNEKYDVDVNELFKIDKSVDVDDVDSELSEILNAADGSTENVVLNTEDKTNNTKSINKELFEALYKGFNGLAIHGDGANVKNEISLYPLFASLYACKNEEIDDDLIDEALVFIKKNNNLTDSAKTKWNKILVKAEEKPSNGAGQLFNYIKQFNEEYYDNVIKPLQHPVHYEFNIKDNFTLRDIERSKYQHKIDDKDEDDAAVFDYNKLLNDLKRVLVVIDAGHELFVLKVLDSSNDDTNKYKLCFLNPKEAQHKFSNIFVGTEINDKGKLVNVSIWKAYNAERNKLMFKKDGIRFFSKNKNVFSFFQGYDYVKTESINTELINPFLEHIKKVWCSGDEHLFNYINTWYASILQNPSMKTKIALVIKGKEGSGKNTITDTWCNLLGCYANSNITNIDEIVGKFNTTLENKKLLVLNEMASVDSNKYMNADIMKALITEQKVMINEKGITARECENVANFIIVSNNKNPVRITTSDRRYCVIKTNESVLGNFEYFGHLHDLIEREDFKQSLFNYYMNYDTHTLDLRVIPETEERLIMKEINKSPVELFVDEYANLLNEGWRTIDCYDCYVRFCVDNGYCKKNKSNFEADLLEFADKDRKQIAGDRAMRYCLKESFKHLIHEEEEINGDAL